MKRSLAIVVGLLTSTCVFAAPEYKGDWTPDNFYGAVQTCRAAIVLPAGQDYVASGKKAGRPDADLKNESIAMTPVFEMIASDACYCALNDYAKDQPYSEFKKNWESSAEYLQTPRCKAKMTESMGIIKDKERMKASVLK